MILSLSVYQIFSMIILQEQQDYSCMSNHLPITVNVTDFRNTLSSRRVHDCATILNPLRLILIFCALISVSGKVVISLRDLMLAARLQMGAIRLFE